ncbi:DUF397 domain-containing protein [Cryptosporangium phraense]|uniref:DUF397 domain-containing protein n=1 Tax=Cryptosporangium phraense TaxID=2593070 RepID=A0A545ALY4_9ACTN|nr:DUF397 domain-containing protein [Cryptosporangium phraense]TQS42280.1 DUF397 domain-containing protein [Cryptosporangium phraense]
MAEKDGVFRKSTFSAYGNCVEVALSEDDVRVRDSKQVPGGAVLAFSTSVWRDFTEGVKAGRFGLPAE